MRFLYSTLLLLLSALLFAQQPFLGEQVESIKAGDGTLLSVQRLARDLNHPWGLTFLSETVLLVTERNSGKLLRIDIETGKKTTIKGTPDVVAMGQGGMMDVALHPTNGYLYLTYAKPGEGAMSTTALGRGRLQGDSLVDFTDIFLQQPWLNGDKHYGNRVVFSEDGRYLYLGLGERFQFEPAQDLDTHFGKVVRLNADGSVPADNPFVGRANAKPENWSYGHRNIESLAVQPGTGNVYLVEMGPLGGDELNRVVRGDNYGWPLESHGDHYDGRDIPDPAPNSPHHQPVRYWNPVISPSGMTFYTGDEFPQWRGHCFVGGLSSRDLVRLRIDGDRVLEEERFPMPGRIREVENGPDGALYLLMDDAKGEVWRIMPLVAKNQ